MSQKNQQITSSSSNLDNLQQITIEQPSATDIPVYIGGWEVFVLAVSFIIPLVTATWFIGTRLSAVTTTVEGLERRFTNLEGRMDNSFAASSPISLLEKGQKILQDSGLKEFVDENKDSLSESCNSRMKMKNPYDIQIAAFNFFDDYKFEESFEQQLKTTSFNYGVTMSSVRRIAGIYFRDVCLSQKGFRPEDLDKHHTKAA